MRRRGLLAAIGTGLTTAIAGCGGGNADDGAGGPEPEAPPVESAVDVLEHRLKRTDEGSFAEKVEVVGRAKNTSDAELTGVQFRVRFYGEDDEELQVRVTDGRKVRPQREWSFDIGFNGTGSSAREVTSYDIEVGEGIEE